MGRKFETRVVELTDQEIWRRLSEFEATYQMTSEEFIKKYNNGELGDERPFMRWAGLLGIAAEAGVYPAPRITA